MAQLTILTETDYFTQLPTAVAQTKAGDRLALTTMNFDPDEPAIATLLRELTQAAARGVQVHLLVDAHAFMFDHRDQPNGPLLRGVPIGPNLPGEFGRKFAALQALQAAGGTYRVINQPARRLTVPVAGRSHIKTVVVNNRIYLGGCNLGHIAQVDCMVRLDNQQAADWLYQFVLDTTAAGNARLALRDTDRQMQLDDHSTLLVDAGKRGQSLIMQSALNLIDEAQEQLLITCQFFPNSTTAAHLAKAHRRGVKVQVFYNHPSRQIGGLAMVQRAVLWGEKVRLPSALFEQQLAADFGHLHAKVLASEKAALVGSHNLVTLGVRLGTAELAIRQADPAFARQLHNTMVARLS